MPRRVEFKGKVHEFPDNATDEQVRAALTLDNPKPAVTESPETFLGGIWKNVNPKALVDLYKSAIVEHQGDIGRALAASMLKASGHQAEKAKEAFKAGQYSETLGHALAAIPGLSSFADAAETMGGEPGQTDKFGNVVKSGVAPNLTGGVGEAIGAAAPLLVGEVAKIPGSGEAVQTAGTAARGAIVEGAKAAVSPSTMVGAGTAEFLGSHVGLPRGVGAASVALPRIAAASVRGAKAALADRVKAAAAKVAGAESVPVPEIPPLYDELAGGPGKFAKMSPEDQMALRSVADRIQNGVSGSAADLEAVAQRKARAMAAQGGGSPAVPIAEAQPVQAQSPEAAGRLSLPNVQGGGGPRRIPMPVGPQAPIVPDVAQQLRESLVPESKAAPGEVATIAGSEPEFAPETYAASARVPKVQKLAAALNEHGISYEDARNMDMSHWKMLSEATGQKIPSATTIEQTLFELKKLEKSAKVEPPKPEKVSPSSASEAGTRTQPKPNMVEASRALAEELGMVERSAKAPEVRYVRFGEPPEGGKSFNSRDAVNESGVSVHRLVKIDGKWHLDEQGASFNTLTDKRPVYEVSGKELAQRGADGEPLLSDVKVVGRYRGTPLSKLPSNVNYIGIAEANEAPYTLAMQRGTGKVQLRGHGALNEAAGFGDSGGWMDPDQLTRKISDSRWGKQHPEASANLSEKIATASKR